MAEDPGPGGHGTMPTYHVTLSNLTSSLASALSTQSPELKLSQIVSSIASLVSTSQSRAELDDAFLDLLPLLIATVLEGPLSHRSIELSVQTIVEEAVRHCSPRESFIALTAALNELTTAIHERRTPTLASFSFQTSLIAATGTTMLCISSKRKASFLNEYLGLLNRWLRVHMTLRLEKPQTSSMEDVVRGYSSGWRCVLSWRKAHAQGEVELDRGEKEILLAAMEAVGLVTLVPETLTRADFTFNGLDSVAMRPGSKLKHARPALDALFGSTSFLFAYNTAGLFLKDKFHIEALVNCAAEVFRSTCTDVGRNAELRDGCALTICHGMLETAGFSYSPALCIRSHILPMTSTLMRAAHRLNSISVLALSLATSSQVASSFAGSLSGNGVVQDIHELFRSLVVPVLAMHPSEFIRSCAHESMQAWFDACSPVCRLDLLKRLLIEESLHAGKDDLCLVSMASVSLQRVRFEMSSRNVVPSQALELARPWLCILPARQDCICPSPTFLLVMARQADAVAAALSVFRLAAALEGERCSDKNSQEEIVRLRGIVNGWMSKNVCSSDGAAQDGSETMELVLAINRLDYLIDQTLKASRGR